MHKKFEINRTKIKDGCQPGRKVVALNSKSDLPLVATYYVHSQVGSGEISEQGKDSTYMQGF